MHEILMTRIKDEDKGETKYKEWERGKGKQKTGDGNCDSGEWLNKL